MVLLYWAFGRVAAFAPSKTLKELWLVYKSPPHYVLSAWAAVLFLYVITRTFRDIQTVIAVLGAGIAVLLLLFSIFLKQNRTLLREIILRHFQDMIDRSNKFCCAIKFDIDLIVAINDYSYATGNEIVHLVHHTLLSHQKELAQRGIEVLSVELPESDEVIWLLPKRSTQEAADIADVIRREVKSALPQVQYYNEACEFVVRKLTNPPLTGEEQQGIGTLSAGVAAHTRGAESLLTDISAAIKEAKFRGRNRTVIYQREHPSIVRDH
jgi:GGDEF domain-containing protein